MTAESYLFVDQDPPVSLLHGVQHSNSYEAPRPRDSSSSHSCRRDMASSATSNVDIRTARLTKFFHDLIHGKRTLNSSKDGELFIEALCSQTDPASCSHKLISSTAGLSVVQSSVRLNISVSFMNEHAARLLQYLQDPSLKCIDSGAILVRILTSIVEPPFFWDAFTQAFRSHALNPAASRAFAWLLFELVCFPRTTSAPYSALARSPDIMGLLLKSPDGETRILTQKIKHSLLLDPGDLHIDAEVKPGGRHDNDHADYRNISIMPTVDELLSQERPFIRTADFIDDPSMAPTLKALHVDNQFRLLREDMLGEIRKEIQILTGVKTGRHKGIIVHDLRLVGVDIETDRKGHRPWGVVLQPKNELPQLKKIEPSKRKAYLMDNKQILRHGNIACLLVDNEPVAFPTIHRNEEELSKIPGKLIVQFQDGSSLANALSKLKVSQDIKVVQLDTAVFAFEPFLKQLQDMKELLLSEELLNWKEGDLLRAPSFQPTLVIEKLRERAERDLQNVLRMKKPVRLDASQMDSLCASLSQRVSLVQGPPGTGKSFIGALIARVLHEYTSQVILVVCFTNHALDQFLEDLMDIGIPSSDMVRLGGKSTDRTKPLTIREQGGSKLSPARWDQINKAQVRLEEHEKKLQSAFRHFSANTSKQQIIDYLEFAEEDLEFYEAFCFPMGNEGETTVGKKGKAVSKFYLLDRWARGEKGAGAFQHILPRGATAVWNMTLATRKACLARWQEAILEDLVSEVCRVGQDFNKDEAEIDRIFAERDMAIIKGKKIIACTTNGAARYTRAIQSASPGVVLVEEAGEILEAHILTAMGPHTEQVILIGDHQQLRPKCSSYELTVDGGNGYDLDRSLFERLVRKGFPHTTLTKQHRMRPEISSVIRHMTYHNLTDADTTLNRDDLRGFRDNVMFINHSELEIELNEFREVRDGASTSSKQNPFEASMVLKCVRYLAQQGYGSDKMVVLTPYLGQLKLLRDELSTGNDPILNDLDKFDLVRAGLLSDLGSKSSKPCLRISTIDNYQGEESDIVIASLTRSNTSHDIGFMKSPERLNVLASRARNGLILVGNSETFIHSRKGSAVWRKLFDHLKQNDHIYEGFPVKCEKHPDRTALLCSPENFDIQCPDGGCKEPCGVLLKCGVHMCPSSCHQLFDHSRTRCTAVLTQPCSKGHSQIWQCDQGFSAPVSCQKCEHERKETENRARKVAEDQQKRDAKTQKHLREIAKIQEDIDKVTQSIKDKRLNDEHKIALVQKKNDLVAAKALLSRTLNESSPPRLSTTRSEPDNSSAQSAPSSNHVTSTLRPNTKKSLQDHIKTCLVHNVSASKTEWQRQKDQENASNPAIDKIMEMIGLEEVKSQVLRIKSKVDTSVRQGTDLMKERLGLVLLGNPGTGKTTVARHYANVLTSLKVLSGGGFVETTGSRLAHGGVTEVKDHLKTLENAEGGIYFIDEAYQLAEGHNYGGKMVLDFLLAEIENLVGRVVFVFAGYRKQMEKFFEHNPGFSSRLPYTLHFDDYKDSELLRMLQYQMGKFYNTPVDVEDGVDGLYMRIAVRRLGRGRGRDGFGNARALENLFTCIRERQSDRLTRERRDGLTPDDNFISKEDLIGPDPSNAILRCDAWGKLQELTGLQSVKNSVRFMIDLIKTNYDREIQEKPLIEVSLNRIFLGSPGTGKTTVAKLYGRILADIGLLSNGEGNHLNKILVLLGANIDLVVVKNPADFIGSVIGQSEANTKAILATTVGKVLIIDEAYMLSSGSGGGGGSNAADMYKTAVIDTIVAEVQSVPGEDRCVLLLGYEDQMVEMFQNVNPGLTRRFQLSEAFRFEDFSDAELQEILLLKLKNQGLGATDRAISVAIDSLSRARNGLNFGNGGDVENLISKAKSNYQTRQSKFPAAERSIDFLFKEQDFDPDFDRALSAEMNLGQLFKDVIGCECIIEKLDGYLKVAKGMRAQGLDPRGQIPMNFVFKGPPGKRAPDSNVLLNLQTLTLLLGTGKTTTARKFGQVYYNLGFLSHVEVVECSASDLVGQFVGQTGPKTIKQLERGLGKVLFVDEAYRLGEGMFAQEAVNELVDTMTKPKFAGKLVIILAGYDNDMNNLLRVNEGLSSRFADEITFPSLNPGYCLQLLSSNLQQSKILTPELNNEKFRNFFSELSELPGWGNARDVQTLAKSMVRTVYQNNTDGGQLVLSGEVATTCIETMLSARRARNEVSSVFHSVHSRQAQPLVAFQDAVQQSKSTTAFKHSLEPLVNEPALECQKIAPDDITEMRDAGVSDTIWMRLQVDKKDADLYATRQEEMIRNQQQAVKAADEVEKSLAAKAKALQEVQARNEHEALELLRQREEARMKELEARAEREKNGKEFDRRRKAEEERKRQEAKAQAKLRKMGICPMGFQWIKQNGGYRCSGGSHWVDDAKIGL